MERPGGSDASPLLPAVTAPLELDIIALQQVVPSERQQDVRSAVQAALEVQQYAVSHKIHPSGIAILSDLSDDTLDTLLHRGPPYTFEVALLTIPTAQSYLQLFFSPRGAQATLGCSTLETKDPAIAETLCRLIDLDVRNTQDNHSGGWEIGAPTEHDEPQERRVVGAVIKKVLRAIATRVGAPNKLSLTGTATAETANAIYRVEVKYRKELVAKGSYTKFSIARDTRQPEVKTSDMFAGSNIVALLTYVYKATRCIDRSDLKDSRHSDRCTYIRYHHTSPAFRATETHSTSRRDRARSAPLTTCFANCK